MLRAASSVLVGTVLPEFAAVNSVEQEALPLEPVHENRALARVFSLLVGTVRFEGLPEPGEMPVAGLTRLLAMRKALSIPVVLVQVAPTSPPLDMNEARAQTAAAVVISLRTKVLPRLMLPQGPSAVMSQRDELVGPEPN